MKVEMLDEQRLHVFIEYCKKHRSEVDDSFLYDADLKKFEANAENPTYVLIDQQGYVAAAASLIMDEYQKRGKRARFRILHSEIPNLEAYALLFQSLLRHTEGLEKLYIFVPLNNEKLAKDIEGLGFSIERYAFLLLREEAGVPSFVLPKGYIIRDFTPGKDEEIWSQVRNAAFAELKGNETPVTKEMVTRMILGEDYLKGGMKILYHGEQPVGVVRGANDEYEDAPIMNIGPLAILPGYQGKGLGRLLLRAALQFAKEHSYSKTILSVNGENEHAKALYLQEGFKQVEGVACYEYKLSI